MTAQACSEVTALRSPKWEAGRAPAQRPPPLTPQPCTSWAPQSLVTAGAVPAGPLPKAPPATRLRVADGRADGHVLGVGERAGSPRGPRLLSRSPTPAWQGPCGWRKCLGFSWLGCWLCEQNEPIHLRFCLLKHARLTQGGGSAARSPQGAGVPHRPLAVSPPASLWEPGAPPSRARVLPAAKGAVGLHTAVAILGLPPHPVSGHPAHHRGRPGGLQPKSGS